MTKKRTSPEEWDKAIEGAIAARDYDAARLFTAQEEKEAQEYLEEDLILRGADQYTVKHI